MANGDPLTAGFLVDATKSTGLRKTTPGSHVYIIWSDFTDSIFSQSGTGTGVTAVGKFGIHAKGIDQFSTGVWGTAVSGIGVLGMVESGFGVALPKGTGVWGQGRHGVGVRGEAWDGWGMIGRSVGGIGIGAISLGVGKAGIQTESTSGPGLVARSDSNDAVVGQSTSGIGVYGASENSGGVYGLSQETNGVTGTSAKGVGVQGVSGPWIGVHGASSDGPGVRGDSQNNIGAIGSSVDSAGVYGHSVNDLGIRGETTYGRAGVAGIADQWLGVQGRADNGVGVGGVSMTGRGAAGRSDTGTGVEAISNSGMGLYARSNSGTAGVFGGDVVVRGNFTVSGVKSAAVPHPDGTLRRLYSMESPESWFEDFGEVELVEGVASVDLDPDFAALVDVSHYQVFLTSYAPVSLYVPNRTPQGFEIRVIPSDNRRITLREPISCGYRVIARRKDIAGPRLDPVQTIDPPAPFEFPDVEFAPERKENALRPVEHLSPPALPDFSPLPEDRLPEPPLPVGSPDEYIDQA